MFRFSHLQGKYHIHRKRITFDEYIKFEIRSPENRAIQLLTQSFQTQGINCKKSNQIREKNTCSFPESVI